MKKTLMTSLYSYTVLFSALALTDVQVPHEKEFIESLEQWFMVPQDLTKALYNAAKPLHTNAIIDKIAEQNKIPLFASYPELEKKIPYISLGSFPTPIQKLNKILKGHKRPTIYLKDDGVAGILQNSNRLFGGNKIRKLEFLLADAQQKNASTVLAIGAFGSNSVTCTANYAHKLGLECIALLIAQPPSKVLQRNLLLMNHYDVIFKIFDRTSLHEIIIESFHECKKDTGQYPYPIPAGGSCPRGILGFVNAAFELKNQIDNKLMPEPDKIYIPLGTGGSSLGLLIGIKALNLKTKIIAVAIEPMNADTLAQQLRKKFDATIQLIKDMDKNFPDLQFDLSHLEIRYKYSGDSYGLLTSTAQQASTIFKKRENINLDGTYTAKAADCMLEELGNIDKDEVILFWNTFCSDDFKKIIKNEKYTSLPHPFHAYFEHI